MLLRMEVELKMTCNHEMADDHDKLVFKLFGSCDRY